MVLIGIPLLIDFILLGVSVGIINGQASAPDFVSMLTIQASGFLPVAILGYFVITIVVAELHYNPALFFQPGSKEMHQHLSMFL